MARLFDDASLQYLEIDSAPVTAVPLTMAAWFYTDVDSASQEIAYLADLSATDQAFRLSLVSGARLRAAVYAGSLPYAESTGTFSTNTWTHACGVFAAADDRAAFLNGGNKGTNSTSATPTGIDRLSVARAGDFTPGNYFSGAVAELAIWNAALSDAEVAILGADRYSPLLVRPQNLVVYLPLVRDNDEDLIGGLSLTAYNSPTVMAHPRILYPAPSFFYPKSTGEAGETLSVNMGADNLDRWVQGVKIVG